MRPKKYTCPVCLGPVPRLKPPLPPDCVWVGPKWCCLECRCERRAYARISHIYQAIGIPYAVGA